MAGLSTYTNYGSVNTEALRLAQAQQQLRGQEDAVAAQLRQTFGERVVEPGTTITAKYQYKVAADGSLYPTSTKITTEVTEPESSLDKQANQKRSGSRRQNDATLADVTRPRPDLSPTDELALFSNSIPATRLTSIPPANNDNVSATVISATVQGEAEGADGEKIDVEILPPQVQSSTPSEKNAGNAPLVNLTARAQQSVANLYARNADLVFAQLRTVKFAA